MAWFVTCPPKNESKKTEEKSGRGMTKGYPHETGDYNHSDEGLSPDQIFLRKYLY
jgi:hypothetical protein